MEEPWAYRKVDAVAAHGSKSLPVSIARTPTGDGDLNEGRDPWEVERRLASCPAGISIGG